MNTPATHTFDASPRVAIPLAAVTKSGKPIKWEIYKLLIFTDTLRSLFGEDFKPCLHFNEK